MVRAGTAATTAASLSVGTHIMANVHEGLAQYTDEFFDSLGIAEDVKGQMTRIREGQAGARSGRLAKGLVRAGAGIGVAAFAYDLYMLDENLNSASSTEGYIGVWGAMATSTVSAGLGIAALAAPALAPVAVAGAIVTLAFVASDAVGDYIAHKTDNEGKRLDETCKFLAEQENVAIKEISTHGCR